MTQKYSAGEPEDTETESPEAKAIEEEFRRELNAWKSNLMTQRIARNLLDESDRALRDLLGAARNSADPSVARYVAMYDSLQKLIKNMKVDDGV